MRWLLWAAIATQCNRRDWTVEDLRLQHRVSACLRNILLVDSDVSFQHAIAAWVLGERRPDLKKLLQWAWQDSALNF